MNHEKDYYAVLGVLPSIDQAALAAVYRALLKKYHPDVYRGPKDEADRITKELNEAYEVLGDAAKRSAYDQRRSASKERSGDYDEASKRDLGPKEASDETVEGWEYVSRYYPNVETQRIRLAQISSALALSYQISVVESKRFDEADALADKTLSEYLRQYFGTNTEVQQFALDAILSGRKDVALEVNRAICALGTPKKVAVEEFIDRVRKRYGMKVLNPNELGVLREILKRCSSGTFDAAVQYRTTGEAKHVSAVVSGVIERFAKAEQRGKLVNRDYGLLLKEDLGIDSLTLMEIVILCEDVLGVSIKNEEIRGWRTVGDVVSFIDSKIRGGSVTIHAPQWGRE